MDYEQKYLKYKAKYLALKQQIGGYKIDEEVKINNTKEIGNIIKIDKANNAYTIQLKDGNIKVFKKDEFKSNTTWGMLKRLGKSAASVTVSAAKNAASATASAAKNAATAVREGSPKVLEAARRAAAATASVAKNAASATASAAKNVVSVVREGSPKVLEAAKSAAAATALAAKNASNLLKKKISPKKGLNTEIKDAMKDSPPINNSQPKSLIDNLINQVQNLF